jgi:hypothetical protein
MFDMRVGLLGGPSTTVGSVDLFLVGMHDDMLELWRPLTVWREVLFVCAKRLWAMRRTSHFSVMAFDHVSEAKVHAAEIGLRGCLCLSA